MLSSTVFSHNCNKLMQIQTDARLIADENGYLREKASLQKPFLARLFGIEKAATHKIINQTCQQLFDQIIKRCPSPLTVDLLQLDKDRLKVKSLLDGVAKLGKGILLPQLAADLRELVQSPETLEARLAIRKGIDPKPLNQTISGTYIMHNRLGQPWGIFKPTRQEVGGDKNPSWAVWASCKAEQWDIKSGTGYLRECAAYQLDKEHFSGVPLTVHTDFTHRILDTSILPLPKPNFEGSFQLFKKSCSSLASKIKAYEFYMLKPKNGLKNGLEKIYLFVMRAFFYLGLPHISKDEIHKMAILDIRILNCDRHLGNCLIENNKRTLYPIDHGLTLPNKAKLLRFEWKNLIQSRFSLSEQSLRYIKNLDPNSDAVILKNLGISIEAIERMKLSTMLLKEAVARKLTLYQIADLMQKKTSSSIYFEAMICHEVLTNGRDPQLVINEAICKYINS